MSTAKPFISWHFHTTAFWIRIANIVIHCKTGTPYFSERYGYQKYWPKWNYWRIGILKSSTGIFK